MTSSLIVASPPTTTERVRNLGTFLFFWRRKRRKIEPSPSSSALVFRRRVALIDRIARGLISISGIGIIAAVLGIGLFLLLEILPLFAGTRVQAGRSQAFLSDGESAQLVLVDEHQEMVAALAEEPTLVVASLLRPQPLEHVAIPGLAGQRVTSGSQILRQSTVALGTAQGTVWIGTIDFQAVFEGGRRTMHPVVTAETQFEAIPGHRITQLAYRHTDTRALAAALTDAGPLIVTRIAIDQPVVGPARRTLDGLRIPLEAGAHPTTLLINGPCTELLVGTSEGQLLRWEIPGEGSPKLLETIEVAPNDSVTSMAYLLGDRSIAIGTYAGKVATWSPVRDEAGSEVRLRRIHTFPTQDAPVRLLIASPRDKGFISVSRDGAAQLHYMTTERTLARWPLHGEPVVGWMAPKANGLVLIDGAGTLRHWRIDNPHPEFSWRALFAPIWYEGYTRPAYIWQSTGTDDAEPKLSLVPLAFGTLKGTVYALCFAIPLALFGALYCSQFLDKSLRNPIKSTIELMAVLPSVVLGFVAGVVMAPLVQQHLVAVLAMPVLMPLVAMGTLGGLHALPIPRLRALAQRREFWVLSAGAVLGVGVAGWLGPSLERACFGGSVETWLQAMGTHYDQRNALVVGWAMGFAVIPIIFTICEDAFSAVPKHLVGASLACGASAWQTAWRVVLPAAGSGVFSAIMVGFGRAVGETMIVLMATGNTPIMDWTVFNGFRALSANIAVEIPEAPHGDTLYRVLFVSALLLFGITFIVNTAAELIRMRLRRQLHGL